MSQNNEQNVNCKQDNLYVIEEQDSQLQELAQDFKQIKEGKLVTSDMKVGFIYSFTWNCLLIYFLFINDSYDRHQCYTLYSVSLIILSYQVIICVIMTIFILLSKLAINQQKQYQKQLLKQQQLNAKNSIQSVSNQQNTVKLFQILMGFGVSFRFIQIVFEIILTTLTGVVMLVGQKCGYLRILVLIYFGISFVLTILIMSLFCILGMKKGPKALYKQLIGESYIKDNKNNNIDESIEQNIKCLPKQKPHQKINNDYNNKNNKIQNIQEEDNENSSLLSK